MYIRIIIAALVCLSTSALVQAGVILQIESDGDVANLNAPFTIDAQFVKENGFGPPISVACRPAGECVMDLSPGTWVISSGDDRVYAEPRSVTVMADQPSPVLPFRLFRASKITGTIKHPPTERVSLTFDGAESDRAIRGQADCAVTERRFLCIVPAGTWDLRIGISRHIPQYRWSIQIRPDKVADLGEFQFKRGASLTGRVEIARDLRLKNPDQIRVTIAPATPLRSFEQQRQLTRAVRATKKGFFQFEGVQPGEYMLTAAAEEAGSEPQTVKIIEDREAELRRPLILARKSTISATILPPQDPAQRQWRIRLRKRVADGRFMDVVQAAADDKGNWQHLHAWPGSYELSLMDETGSVWMWKGVDVRSDVTVDFQAEATPLTGELRLGDRPIAGRLHFRNAAGADIEFVADSTGAFSGFLTAQREERWTVNVESPELGIQRELRDVRPTYTPEGSARVKLTLPLGQVAGKVLREDGTAVTFGWVNVTSREGAEEVQVRLDRDGGFVINGLPRGHFMLQAEALGSKEPLISDVVHVTVSDEPAEEISLVVRPDVTLRGVVVSQGTPVVGAQITVMPTDRLWLSAARRTSDANGRFEALVPSGTTEVDILVKAPSFATRVFHTRLWKGDLTIRLAQSGGELAVTASVWNHDNPLAAQPWIIHDGAIVHARAITEERWGEKTVVFHASQVDPGVYAVCIATIDHLPQLRAGDLRASKCVTRMVPPFGRTEFDLTN